jgi:uncharacterized protein (PEP-CTERM system associated)
MVRRRRHPANKSMKRAKPERLSQGVAWLLVLLALPAWSQSGADGRALRLDTSLGLTQTYTDNLRLSSTAKDAALITQISPGLRVSSSGGRLRGDLDYTLNGLLYSRSESANQTQHRLSARANAELIEDRLSVDATASISQQTLSAFGPTSASPVLPGGNTAEVYSLSLRPVLRGQLAGLFSYSMQAAFTEARAKDSVAGDASSHNLSMQLGGLGATGLLGWSAQLSRLHSAPRQGRSTDTEQGSVSLLLRPDPEWSASLTVGRERADLATPSARNGSTYGFSAQWQPQTRTRLSLDWQHHEYGDTHSISLEHRMARSVWRFVDSQSVNRPGLQGNGGGLSNYDLLFALAAGREPDLQKRDVLVRQQLAQLGLDPNALVQGGFVNSSNSLMRRQEASFALQGLRTSATFTLSRTRSELLDPVANGRDDFSNSSRIRQQVYALNLAHRLTPDSSLTLTLSQLKSRGELSSQYSALRSVLANWSARLGPRSSLVLGLRHSDFESSIQPYRENAVLATFTQQF